MLAPNESVLWPLVDAIPDDARNEQEMSQILLANLSRLLIPQVARFQHELLDCMGDLLNWRLWEAADIIHSVPCSGDIFVDFRFWVVAQGGQKC
ncbi:DUF4240 domain-containing protein [Longispora sp. K20-0274]|uniref:DUF4240 domain-containing protein n=1 Tax=Longispora sp. K20-0274 TaxID=3088255 RepID=UPI00399A2178